MTTNSNNPFDQAGGGNFDAEELNGSLVVIWPQSVESVNTVHGEQDAVRANVLVVDGEKAGEFIEDGLVFPRVLVSSLRGKVGRQVLGRIGQGIAKPGQSAPWIIEKYGDEDVEVALAAIAAHQSGQFDSAEDTPPAAPAKAAPAKAAAKPAAKPAPKATVPQDKIDLANTLLGSGVPAAAVEQSTGFSAADLAAAGVDIEF